MLAKKSIAKDLIQLNLARMIFWADMNFEATAHWKHWCQFSNSLLGQTSNGVVHSSYIGSHWEQFSIVLSQLLLFTNWWWRITLTKSISEHNAFYWVDAHGMDFVQWGNAYLESFLFRQAEIMVNLQSQCSHCFELFWIVNCIYFHQSFRLRLLCVKCGIESRSPVEALFKEQKYNYYSWCDKVFLLIILIS